jgi:hypothetical protein
VNKSGRVPGWDLYDHDLAFIDASTLEVYYATGLMNICMALGVNPATGQVTVVGTDGTNEKRFEPNVNGTFVRVRSAQGAFRQARRKICDPRGPGRSRCATPGPRPSCPNGNTPCNAPGYHLEVTLA